MLGSGGGHRPFLRTSHCEDSDKGRPGIESRFVVGLLLLKHIFALSDEQLCERWVYDPYFQHFTGEEFFQHAFPHERSDLSHWRQRLGDKLELLLAESLRVAHEAGALRTKDLKRVTVDTTVQPKAISFPTDAKLLHAAIRGLARLARKHGVKLRQSYQRIAKRAAMMAGRYAHAQQFKRHHRELRFLRSRLGRIILPWSNDFNCLADLSHDTTGLSLFRTVSFVYKHLAHPKQAQKAPTYV